MIYVDFHTHTDDIELYDGLKVYALINCMTIEDVEKWLPISEKSPYIKLSIGSHPNGPEKLKELIPHLKRAHVIGEIGLDNIWTSVDMTLQKESFQKSLELAVALEKPIILHTKGMGEEIFKTLQNYKMMKIIHWYSDDIEIIKKYPLENVFYTIGPDVYVNKHVQDLVDYLEPEQMLVETDGLEALEWAFGKGVVKEDIIKHLDNTLNYISDKKNVDKIILMKQMENIFKSL